MLFSNFPIRRKAGTNVSDCWDPVNCQQIIAPEDIWYTNGAQYLTELHNKLAAKFVIVRSISHD
jgi:hypothetical protein